MKRRLHVHFGIHRTGTTSIHKLLSGNLVSLRQMGICYPEVGVKHRHVKLAWNLKSGKISPEQLSNQLLTEVPESANLVILSSEDFSSMRNLEWLRILSGEYAVSASVYLKRQDAWLESWYNQNIKWPWNKKLSCAKPGQFLKHTDEFHWLDYVSLLDTITSVVPRDSLYVNVVDSAGVRDTVKDFLRHCDIDASQLEAPEIENESITAAKLDIVRRIDLFKLNPDARRKILMALDSLEIEEDDGSKTVFDDEQVQEILVKYEQSNNSVAKKYFGREKLFHDPVKLGRVPPKVQDKKAYRVYIPQLLKEVASK